jgi:hypothetical protein
MVNEEKYTQTSEDEIIIIQRKIAIFTGIFMVIALLSLILICSYLFRIDIRTIFMFISIYLLSFTIGDSIMNNEKRKALTNDVSYRCSICDITFETEPSYTKHLISEHGSMPQVVFPKTIRDTKLEEMINRLEEKVQKQQDIIEKLQPKPTGYTGFTDFTGYTDPIDVHLDIGIQDEKDVKEKENKKYTGLIIPDIPESDNEDDDEDDDDMEDVIYV